MELTCPKCHGTMRTYERNGVHVDQCADCRGIFLDRGELDRLIDAENSWHGSRDEHVGDRPSAHQPSSQHAAGGGLGGVVGEVLRQVQGSKSSSHSGYPHKRKKESFRLRWCPDPCEEPPCELLARTCPSTSLTTEPSEAAGCWGPGRANGCWEESCWEDWCPPCCGVARPPCQSFSASTRRSNSPRSRTIPRHSVHWSTWTPLRS